MPTYAISRSSRIRELLDAGHSTREVADAIGCSTEYVRAVKQRRAGKDGPDYKHRQKLMKLEVGCETAGVVAKLAFDEAIAKGLSKAEAWRLYDNAYRRERRRYARNRLRELREKEHAEARDVLPSAVEVVSGRQADVSVE